MTKIDVEIIAFKRGLLRDRLAQCTEKQREFFDRIWQGREVPDDKLVSAIALCDRTIASNPTPSKETP